MIDLLLAEPLNLPYSTSTTTCTKPYMYRTIEQTLESTKPWTFNYLCNQEQMYIDQYKAITQILASVFGLTAHSTCRIQNVVSIKYFKPYFV